LIIDPSVSTTIVSTSGQTVRYVPTGNCDYCSAPAEFIVTYYPKKDDEYPGRR
jgi:hypothetical protein